ncbi:glycerate kinase [Microbacterium aurum]
MTRVVVAVDSFKGSIGAADAAAAVRDGWAEARGADEIVLLPMADGGEGTLDAFAAAVPGARRMPVTVCGPHGREITASWLPSARWHRGRGTGVDERNRAAAGGCRRAAPWDADTRGFGEAIAAALDHGVERLVLGIGSSASTDGGVGMLTALGARFTDASGAPLAPGVRGLVALADADLSGLRPLPPGGAVVLSDVTNPLCGPGGAAAVFGPQKGLDAEAVAVADAALARLAGLVAPGAAPLSPAASFDTSDAERAPSRRARPISPADSGPARQHPAHSAHVWDAGTPGAGAAGGTGFGLLAWGAELVRGAERVAELIHLAEAIAAADLVITGGGLVRRAVRRRKGARVRRAAGVRVGRARRVGGRTHHGGCRHLGLRGIRLADGTRRIARSLAVRTRRLAARRRRTGGARPLTALRRHVRGEEGGAEVPRVARRRP